LREITSPVLLLRLMAIELFPDGAPALLRIVNPSMVSERALVPLIAVGPPEMIV
jgi:hypothetical protein